MSNPISYFFVLSEYEKHFRHSWLQRALPAAEYARVWDLHLTFLKELYPTIYAYGPNGAHVSALISALTVRFTNWRPEGEERRTMLTFLHELESLFTSRFPLGSDVLQLLQQDSRVMEIFLYSPHGGDEPVNRSMRRLLDATTGLGTHPALPADVRHSLQQNLESLLSITAAADLIDTHPAYHELYSGYLAFLRNWSLPTAQQIIIQPTRVTQDSLSYITDH